MLELWLLLWLHIQQQPAPPKRRKDGMSNEKRTNGRRRDAGGPKISPQDYRMEYWTARGLEPVVVVPTTQM